MAKGRRAAVHSEYQLKVTLMETDPPIWRRRTGDASRGDLRIESGLYRGAEAGLPESTEMSSSVPLSPSGPVLQSRKESSSRR